MTWKIIEARYGGNCTICAGCIDQGETCYWESGTGIKHLVCPERPEPGLVIQ